MKIRCSTSPEYAVATKLRKSRKVIFIYFSVKRKNGSEQEVGLLTSMNQQFGIDIGMAKKLLSDFSADQIESALGYTRQKLEEGAIVPLNGRKTPNVGGFAVNAIRKGMMPSHVGVLDSKPNRVGGCSGTIKQQQEVEKSNLGEIQARLENDLPLKQKLQNQFALRSTGITKQLLDESGFDNPIVQHQFLCFVEERKVISTPKRR